MKIRPKEAYFFFMRTDRHEEAIVTFRNFANSTKKCKFTRTLVSKAK
jgi:hypothetical protein